MLREALLGLFLGTLTGITPGIHVNTLASMLRDVVLSPVVLFAMGLTHTFLDVLPSTFLGVPDGGTALSVLPAHRLVLRGKGLEVVRIALVASFLATLFSILLIPIYIRLAPLYRPAVGKIAVIFLIVLLVATEDGVKRLYALFVVFVSGAVGLLVLSLPLREPFYALFTGLFGVPVIASSIGSGTRNIEPGKPEVEIAPTKLAFFSFYGTLSGMLASLFPAFTASQAALLGTFVSRDERSFLTVVYSLNTANFLFAFFNFLKTGRERNGIVALMEPLGLESLPQFVLLALFVGLATLLYGEALAALCAGALSRLPYRLINFLVLVFLIVLAFVFDGVLGLLALAASSITGYLAVLLGVKRTNCMGSLMLPVLLR